MMHRYFGFFMHKQAHANTAQPSKRRQIKSRIRVVKMAFVPHAAEQHNRGEVRQEQNISAVG
jgi:hypothetical protein